MAKTVPIEVVISVDHELIRKHVAEAQAAAWLEGMTHALTWLGLKHYGEVMAKDNPYGGGK